MKQVKGLWCDHVSLLVIKHAEGDARIVLDHIAHPWLSHGRLWLLVPHPSVVERSQQTLKPPTPHWREGHPAEPL